jgi:hypothetical protein
MANSWVLGAASRVSAGFYFGGTSFIFNHFLGSTFTFHLLQLENAPARSEAAASIFLHTGGP